MPLQIHLIVDSEGSRSHGWYPKRWRNQWTGHLHIVDHSQSKGLLGFCALRTFPWAARQPWQCCSGWRETLDKDHLWVEVTTYEVVNSFQGKEVCGPHLPWVGWSWCRHEGCCSILGLELGAGLTLMNNFFNGFVYVRPEDASACEQLGFCDSLMELVELL